MLSKLQEIQEMILKNFNKNGMQNDMQNDMQNGIQNGIQNDIISDELFKLPIAYIDEKYPLQENVKTDLELLSTDNCNSLYNYILNPSDNYANKIIPMWGQYYSTNVSFLKDSQYLLKNFKHIPQSEITDINNVTAIIDEISNETSFHEKYKYLDIKFLESLNNSSFFLQGLTLYNLTSPIISLAVPILMLIIPFFILKIQKIRISLQTYISTLITVFKNHIVGKTLTEFTNVGWDRKVFLIISLVFYFINIYQNITSCRAFYKNIYKIRNYLLTINKFIKYSINSIHNLNQYCRKSYSKFTTMNNLIKDRLVLFNNEITIIQLEIISVKQITKIGEILRAFYQLFKNKIYKTSLIYSLYLHGYIQNITNLQNNIVIKNINYCKFTKKNTSFTNAYFASLINETPVKNTYKLDKHLLITGPNAAGKTTLLKTTLFNIILSQQLGIGLYTSASINPYTYIHSYINIPDTSGRDSLFQAEARRCKEILDCISTSDASERHFCIFDEIYSGTNPSEAIASAYSFLKYISHKNIDYILTTHYFSLCKLMNKVYRINNYQMEIKNSKNTYKLITGISDIKGGIKVLEELNYNNEIIRSAKNMVNKINI